MTALPAFSSLDYQYAAALKALLALLALVLLAWWYFEERRPRPRARRTRNVALAGLGFLCLLGWANFGQFHFGGGYVHYHEFFHYYLGSKYLPELGYTGLYDCVTAVDLEDGRAPDVANRWIRDLTTNELRRGSESFRIASDCRQRFTTPGRWDAFRADVAWFRSHVSAQKWNDLLTDHGYNATPVWSVAGSLLANTGPASSRQIWTLALIDPVLLGVMAALIWWAFGWQVLCVALVWWGTNYPARYNFTGGAFLRQDWLLLAIAAICFAKRRWMWASGFALTWSALLRIFPGFLAIGLALGIVVEMWRTRSLRPAPGHLRFAGGALLALALIFPLSFLAGGPDHSGLAGWRGFYQNSEKLLSTPLTNHVGLPVVLSFDPSTRAVRLQEYWLDSPWDMWKDARRRVLGERRALYYACVVGFLVLLGAAARSQEEWVVLVLGIGAIPILSELTSYYYSILLGLAFLWPRHQIAGIGLAATALLTALVPAVLAADDDRYTAISAIIVLFVVAVLLSVLLRERRTART